MKTQTLSSEYLPPYIAYPRFLLDVDISETSKLIYSLLLDRARISLSNEQFKNDMGQSFVLFTIENLAKITGKSEISIKRCLKSLEENELIKRENQGLYKPNKIFVKIPESNKNDTHTGNKNDTRYVSKTTQAEYQKGYTNNKYNNNNKNIKIYGEYKNVFLSEEDILELENTVPLYIDYIERLSSYLATTGKKYGNHLATIKHWAEKDKVVTKTSYDLSDF